MVVAMATDAVTGADVLTAARAGRTASAGVFFGETSARKTGGLATPIPGGTEVFVIPAVQRGGNTKSITAESRRRFARLVRSAWCRRRVTTARATEVDRSSAGPATGRFALSRAVGNARGRPQRGPAARRAYCLS